MPANNTCPNCGVPISETPEEDGFHPIQMETPAENGETYCEACAFRAPDHGEYEHDGDSIVRASQVEMGDQELARALASELSAQELRSYMSAYGLTRSRGARKLESAIQAVEQDRVTVAATIDSIRGISNTDPHTAVCSCGFEQFFGDEEAAIEAAERHKSENPNHFPKAWGNGERRLYG